MVKKTKTVSQAELKILEVLWENSPLSASQIIDALDGYQAWTGRTIKSLITRLVKKKVIAYKEMGNRYFYYPVLNKNEYLQTASMSFISRLFGGKVSPLVAHFAKIQKISSDDIAELRDILNALESDD